MASLPEQLLELLELFTDVATADPVSPVLLAAGAAITGGAVGVVAVLMGGALADVVARSLE